MPDDNQKRLDAPDRATLTPLVRRLLNDGDATVRTWRYETVEGGFGHAYGVYRLQGVAQLGTVDQPWSLILKVLSPAAGSHDPGGPAQAAAAQHHLLDLGEEALRLLDALT